MIFSRLLLPPLHPATLAAALAVALAPMVGTAGAAEVSTLAGSGAAGFGDGAPTSATFTMPTSIAYDRAGNLLVVDTAAQRIRRVLSAGTVETLAGSGSFEKGRLEVRGAFADGPGRSARFNWPRGITVMNDGTVIVADTGNHCLRAISPKGDVTVFAGSPQHAGHDLGPRRSATFGAPMGLSTDTDGNLYVADPQAGVRKIDLSGTVTEVGLFRMPIGVTIVQNGATRTIYVVDADGIHISYPDGTKFRLRSDNFGPPATPASPAHEPAGTVERDIAMQMPVGYALNVSALPNGSMFYADPRRNEVTFAFPGYEMVTPIAGYPTEGTAETAGFRDGHGSAARFNAPTGTAAQPDGKLVAVADTGNRRIRLLTLDPVNDYGPRQSLVPFEPGTGHYNVVYLGNSFTWYDSTGRDGITGLIARYLDDDGALRPFSLTANVRAFGGLGSLDPLDSVTKTIADIGADDAVILSVNSLNIEPDNNAFDTTAGVWQPKLTARLRAARDTLAAAHIRFFVVLYPLGGEFSANEVLLSRMGSNGMATRTTAIEPIRQAVTAAGVDIIDTYDDFHADAMRPSAPVSNMADPHFTPHGREVMARSIVRQLEAFAPWKIPKATASR